MAEFKLDIFSILRKLNSGDLHTWEKLSEDEKKGFSPYVITQWMWGNTHSTQAYLINALVNPYLFSFQKNHTELLAKLLAVCGTGGNRQFKWVPFTKKGKEQKIAMKVVMEYWDFSESEAKGNLSLLSAEDVIQCAEELGYEKDELAKLKKELKG